MGISMEALGTSRTPASRIAVQGEPSYPRWHARQRTGRLVGSPERESSNGSPTPQYEGVLNIPDDRILNFRAQSSSLLYGMVAVA